MELKDYNKIQVVVFKHYNLIKNPNFSRACEIIGKYRELNNKFTFLKFVVKDLKNEKII